MELVRLPWDSDLFGISVARVQGQPDPAELVAAATSLGVSCAYFSCDASDVSAIRAAERSGFRLADVRMALEASLGQVSRSDPTMQAGAIVVDRPGANDRPGLLTIVEELSAYSRFARDDGFGPSQARRLYRRWLDESLDGRADVVFVARKDAQVMGLLTIRNAQVPNLELVAVLEAATGGGVGSRLVAAAVGELRARGHERMEVVTQGHNTRALRFYERSGFRIRDVALVYHRWFGASEPSG